MLGTISISITTRIQCKFMLARILRQIRNETFIFSLRTISLSLLLCSPATMIGIVISQWHTLERGHKCEDDLPQIVVIIALGISIMTFGLSVSWHRKTLS